MALVDRFFRDLAGELGIEWEQLATQLNFTLADIHRLKSDTNGLANTIFNMLIEWRQQQPTVNEGVIDLLIEALRNISRSDLTENVRAEKTKLRIDGVSAAGAAPTGAAGVDSPDTVDITTYDESGRPKERIHVTGKKNQIFTGGVSNSTFNFNM